MQLEVTSLMLQHCSIELRWVCMSLLLLLPSLLLLLLLPFLLLRLHPLHACMSTPPPPQ
jgi:hypothetical protein